jgi:hypothetical protein
MHTGSIWSETAAWVEAVGAIAAVIGSGWVAARDSRETRRREERAEDAVLRREAAADLATRNAALNLAILAATQINALHVRLQDQAWRGRVARISASRSLLATQQMLIAFPIQSLGDAPAMVAFSRFPGSLATAAEVYANLEKDVRAVSEGQRSAIFDEYNVQMERVDEVVNDQLAALRTALKLDDQAEPAAPSATTPARSGST